MKKLLTITLCFAIPFALQAQNVKDYKKYFGDYKVENAPFEKIIIEERDGAFWGEAVGNGDSELLLTETENTFELESVEGATLVFTANADGIFTSLSLNMEEGNVTGERQFPSLDDYNGIYIFAEGPITQVEVTNDENTITIDTPEFGASQLGNTSIIGQFFEASYRSDFVFVRNEEGDVISLKIDVPSQGLSMEGIKEIVEEETEEVASEGLQIDLYVGEYDFPDMGFGIEVENRGGKLYVSSDQGEGVFLPTDEPHLFKADGVDVSVAFILNDNKEVIEIILNYQGQPMSGVPAE